VHQNRSFEMHEQEREIEIEQKREQELSQCHDSGGFTVTRSLCTIATPEHLKTVCKLEAKPEMVTNQSTVRASPGRVHRE
jgi:hypothetical protein